MKRVDSAHLWLLCALTLVLAACSDDPESPEQQLIRTMDTMEEAIEAGERDGFIDHVADDFTGNGGRFDRSGLGNLLRMQMLRHTRLSAVVTDREITLFDQRATVNLKMLLTGGARAFIPESGRLYQVNTGWKRVDSQWMLISADWEPVF